MRKLWALLKDREWVIVAILAIGVVLWATWQREEIFTVVDAAVLVLIACTVAVVVFRIVEFIARRLQDRILTRQNEQHAAGRKSPDHDGGEAENDEVHPRKKQNGD